MLTTLATWFVRTGRSIGRLFGRELVIEQSDHSIQLYMEKPNNDERAWDGSMFKRGQIFVEGYANPVKHVVTHNPGFENKDVVDSEEGNVDDDDTDDDDTANSEVIASPRYQQYMEQELISQLLNPKSQWDKLVYGMLGIGALQFFSIITILWATGSF